MRRGEWVEHTDRCSLIFEFRAIFALGYSRVCRSASIRPQNAVVIASWQAPFSSTICFYHLRLQFAFTIRAIDEDAEPSSRHICLCFLREREKIIPLDCVPMLYFTAYLFVFATLCVGRQRFGRRLFQWLFDRVSIIADAQDSQ